MYDIVALGELLIDFTEAGATLAATACARSSGSMTLYDPNHRPLLWQNAQTAGITVRSVLPLVGVIKLSQEELPLLTGETGPARAAARSAAIHAQ